MKRDMELIRLLMFRLEKDDPRRLIDDRWDDETIGHHRYLIYDAGWATGEEMTMNSDSHRQALLADITWAGHEALDAIRDQGVWDQVKHRVSDAAQSVPVSLALEVARAIMKGKLGLP